MKVSIKAILLTMSALSAIVITIIPSSLDLCARGLIMNIAGVVITFFYGMPQPIFEMQGVLVVEDGTPDNDGICFGSKRKKGQLQRKLYAASAYIGLLYLLIGFILQFLHQVRN